MEPKPILAYMEWVQKNYDVEDIPRLEDATKNPRLRWISYIPIAMWSTWPYLTLREKCLVISVAHANSKDFQ